MPVDYVPRRLPGGFTDVQLYDWAAREGKNVLLTGPTGEGKSLSVADWARRRGVALFEVNFAFGVDSSHVVGGWIPDGAGGFRWRDGVAVKALRHGRPCVLFLDEINRVHHSVLAHLHPLLDDDRRLVLDQGDGSVVRPSAPVLIVAAMNPPDADYAGASALDAALRRRFACQVDWDPDDAVLDAVVPDGRLREFARAARRAGARVPTAALVEWADAATGLGEDAAWRLLLSRWDPGAHREELEELSLVFRDTP